MKFSIHRDPLLAALQKAQSVVEKKSTVPILSNILCVVKDGQLSLSATDLEVGIRITLPVENSQDGKLTLSAKNFLDIVKELPAKNLEITRKENNWTEIICGKSKFNVVSLAADEFPALPQFEEKNYNDARVEALKEMIQKTSFAVATDPTRYNLNGVYFENIENNIMRMTATDGHRLSLVDQEVFMTIPDLKRGLIIPKKGLNEFKKLLDEASTSIGMAFERGYIFIRMDQSFLFVRLIEGEYPDYRQVIPKEADKTAVLPREEFNSALKRVSLLAHEKSRGVKLSLQAGQLTITSSNPDMGEAREELDITYSGDPIEIGFNARYLLDCLSVMVGDQIQFNFTNRMRPGILREVGKVNHTYMIMPMSI
ncbi:MAG: DNA polymerase III subunit beta [Bdellovibrionales bacterium]|nr:DNA polymerase III subunit beta [Bdellovibrionales bacterium]